MRPNAGYEILGEMPEEAPRHEGTCFSYGRPDARKMPSLSWPSKEGTA